MGSRGRKIIPFALRQVLYYRAQKVVADQLRSMCWPLSRAEPSQILARAIFQEPFYIRIDFIAFKAFTKYSVVVRSSALG